MAIADLTAAHVRELLTYNPLTGEFFRAKKTNRRVIVGARADFQTPRGYRRVSVMNVRIYAHQAAWLYVYGSLPKEFEQIDHINGDKSDNRIANLRAVTASVNSQNERRARPQTLSKLLGAHWCTQRQKFRASIRVGAERIELGFFTTAQAAHEAYVAAKRLLHPGCTI